MNGYSYSAINTYQRCPKQYEFKFGYKIQRKKKNLALFNGINAHEMMKEFFLALQNNAADGMNLQQRKDEAWACVEEWADDQSETGYLFEDELASAERELGVIKQVVRNYIDQYAEEWEILHVEEEFILMLDTGDVITFTPDLVVRDRNGAVWIVDHKTTSGTVEEGLPFGDQQALLYFAGVQALYPETAGFIFSRMRKKLPTQPRLAKTGKTRVADVARIDTTYEILRDFLQDKAPGLLSDPVHQRRLAQLRDAGNRFFWTEQVYVNETAVQSVINDAAFVLNQIKQSDTLDHYPRHLLESRGYRDCRKCEFRPLCQAQLLGWSTTELLFEEYEPRDPKNPYEEDTDGQD